MRRPKGTAASHTPEPQDDEGPWRPVLPGGESMPGTPPSRTCSVHSDPDQYRCSCRPEGSISQPGAIPVNVTAPDDPSTASDAGRTRLASVNAVTKDSLADPGDVAERRTLASRTDRRRPPGLSLNYGRSTCPQLSVAGQRDKRAPDDSPVTPRAVPAAPPQGCLRASR